jgi:hypothetical protein
MSAEGRPNHPFSVKRDQSAETRRLLHPEASAFLPTLEEVNPAVDIMAQVKFTAPEMPSWALYVAAFDGEDLLYGLWASFYEVRVGFFSLSELENAPQTLQIEVQRDEHFEPMSLRELTQFHEAHLQT